MTTPRGPDVRFLPAARRLAPADTPTHTGSGDSPGKPVPLHGMPRRRARVSAGLVLTLVALVAAGALVCAAVAALQPPPLFLGVPP